MRPFLLSLLFLTPLVGVPSKATPSIPKAALKYQRAVVGNVRAVWGLNGPVAVMAAQIHQESGWNPQAQSPYASGLAQFTPETAIAISLKHPEDLVGTDTFNPSWAIRALTQYDYDLYLLEPHAINDCERWAFTLSAYNGGRGNVLKQEAASVKNGDIKTAWFNHVERYPIRSPKAHEENVQYPRRILFTIQSLYLGWGLGIACPTQ